jgi:hypothetical protein
MTKPIILSKDELRAALDGTLTEVRRKVKPQPPTIEEVRSRTGTSFSLFHRAYNGDPIDLFSIAGPVGVVCDIMGVRNDYQWRCPYPTGTRMWVKETWCPGRAFVIYRADCCDPKPSDNTDDWNAPVIDVWRPSTTMNVRDCRLTLRVESVAVSNDGGTWWWVYGVALERKDAR